MEEKILDSGWKMLSQIDEAREKDKTLWPKMPKDIYLFIYLRGRRRARLKFCHRVKCNKHGTICRICRVIEVLTPLLSSNFISSPQLVVSCRSSSLLFLSTLDEATLSFSLSLSLTLNGINLNKGYEE